MDPADYAALVEEARLAYDPDGELPAIADIWISAEPGDDFVGEVEEPRSFADAPSSVLACFAEYGVSAEDLDADPALLTTEINEACVVSYEEQAFSCLADGGFDLETLDFDNLPPEAAASLE